MLGPGDGLGTPYFTHSFGGKPLVTDILIDALAIGLAYHTLLKPSGIAPRSVRATSTKGGQAGPPTQEVDQLSVTTPRRPHGRRPAHGHRRPGANACHRGGGHVARAAPPGPPRSRTRPLMRTGP